MKNSLLQMLILILAASAIGLAYNAFSPSSIPLSGGKDGALESQGFRVVSLEEVRYYLDEKKAVLVDARTPEEYSLGHIEGALNISVEAFEDDLKSKTSTLKGVGIIITYCGGGSCGTSEEVAQRLLDKGYSNVAVFTDGLPGWMKAKLPVKSGTEP